MSGILIQFELSTKAAGAGLRDEWVIAVVLGSAHCGVGQRAAFFLLGAPEILLIFQATDPALHVTFALGAQEVAAVGGLDHEAVHAVVAVLEPSDGLDAQQVDNLGRFLRALVLVVLEFLTFEGEEALVPLRREQPLRGFHLVEVATDGNGAAFSWGLHARRGSVDNRPAVARRVGGKVLTARALKPNASPSYRGLALIGS